MKQPSEFQVQADDIAKIVRQAVDEKHMSLSEIAGRAGLSVPTIARIYNQEVQLVQAKTARRIAEGLGYDIEVMKTGRTRLQAVGEKQRHSDLSSAQKAQIRRALTRALDEVLDKL